jgi:hypothetical protein
VAQQNTSNVLDGGQVKSISHVAQFAVGVLSELDALLYSATKSAMKTSPRTYTSVASVYEFRFGCHPNQCNFRESEGHVHIPKTTVVTKPAKLDTRTQGYALLQHW